MYETQPTYKVHVLVSIDVKELRRAQNFWKKKSSSHLLTAYPGHGGGGPQPRPVSTGHKRLALPGRDKY